MSYLQKQDKFNSKLEFFPSIKTNKFKIELFAKARQKLVCLIVIAK